MITEQRLAELIKQYAHYTTERCLFPILLNIDVKDIPNDMSEEEIIEKVSTIREDFTPAETSDFCDDSKLEFKNPFTGEPFVFYAMQGGSFFSTFKGGDNRERLKKMLGYDPYE